MAKVPQGEVKKRQEEARTGDSRKRKAEVNKYNKFSLYNLSKSFVTALLGLFIACDPACAAVGAILLFLITHEHTGHFKGLVQEIAIR